MLPDTAPLPDLPGAATPEPAKPSARAALWIAIVFAGIAGNAGIALSPLLLSGMAQFLNFGDQQLGELAAGASIGSSLVTLSAVFFMGRKGWPLRRTVILALCVYAGINLAIPLFFSEPQLLQVAIFLGGCCSGMVWSAAATALTTVRNNERMVAVFYGTPYLTGLIVQPLMPMVFANWGLGTAYTGIAGASILALLMMRAFPARGFGSVRPLEGLTDAGSSRTAFVGVAIVMIALLLQYLANSGVWVYFDRIGHVSGHTPQASANVVALGSGMALVGTALAIFFTTRLRPLPTVIAINAAMAVVTLLLLLASNYIAFALAVSLFNMMITFVTPFFIILLIRISSSPGRIALGANICMFSGFAFGPLIVGRLADSGDFSIAIGATSIAFLLSGLVILAGAMSGRFRT